MGESNTVVSAYTYSQGLKIALVNLQNASENKKSRAQSSNLSHFFLQVQKNRGKQSIWANLKHN